MMVAGQGLEEHRLLVLSRSCLPAASAVQGMVSAQRPPHPLGSAVTRVVCWGRLGAPGGRFPQLSS